MLVKEEVPVQQATIARSVECGGTGLHSGQPVRVELSPAAADEGVVFVGSDGVPVRATIEAVRSSERATVLGSSCGQASFETVEHLLAVLSMLRVDNVRVRVDGSELPAKDGSALPFLALVRGAGRVELPAPCRAIELVAAVEVAEGDRFVRAEPSAGFRLEYGIEFAHVSIGRQEVAFDRLDAEVFEREIAPARTFGFFEDVESLRAAGLARGATLENTVVLDDRGLMNEEALRFSDEFVRHKALDLLGDLALLGAPLRASVRAEKAGHRLHHQLVRAILDQAGARRAAAGA